MKRKLVAVLFVSVLALLLTGCCIKHDWQEATCETPKICTKCGKSEETALGHEWGAWKNTVAATYAKEGKEERICTHCGNKEERALPCIENDFLGTWYGYKRVEDGKETTFSIPNHKVEVSVTFYEDDTFVMHWYVDGKDTEGYPLEGPYKLKARNRAGIGDYDSFSIEDGDLMIHLGGSVTYYFQRKQ